MSPDCPALPEPGPVLITAMSLPTERTPRARRSLRAALFLRAAFLAFAAIVLRAAPFFRATPTRFAVFFLRATFFWPALARTDFFRRFVFFLAMRRVYHSCFRSTIEGGIADTDAKKGSLLGSLRRKGTLAHQQQADRLGEERLTGMEKSFGGSEERKTANRSQAAFQR